MSNSHTVTVDADSAGYRLDKFLSMALPDISRARLQAMIEAGAVLKKERTSEADAVCLPPSGEAIDGGFIKERPRRNKPPSHPSPGGGRSTAPAAQPVTNSSYKVKTGDIFTLTIPDIVALDLTPATGITLNIVYEDDAIIILNKPAGMTVHPAAGTHGDTLVHALLSHCGESLSGIGGVARPGIVHRIDKETSGLLVVAKTDAAHQHLSAQLKERTLKRRYLAFVWTALTPREGEVDAPIARHPRHRRQMAVIEAGKHAITHYETLAAYHIPGNITPLASKIACDLETGRTHQIRVHMLHMKCPLMGDPVYGMPTTTRMQRLKSAGYRITDDATATLLAFNRQALHAAELTLIHPKTNEEMHFECPLPADMLALETTLNDLTIRA